MGAFVAGAALRGDRRRLLGGLAHLAPLADLFVHDRARLACAVLGQLRAVRDAQHRAGLHQRSEEHTSELQSLMRISYAVFCLKKQKKRLTIRNLKPPNGDTYLEQLERT